MIKHTEHKTIADQYAVLMYKGPESPYGKEEYWIGLNGHAHSQAASGLVPGTLGKLFHNSYYRAVTQAAE
jgi:hypothetical protein